MELITHISRDTGLKSLDILMALKSAPYRYKVYEVPKRNGKGTRIIAQPAKEIKLFQRWVVRHVLNHLPLHECVTAYEKGTNILGNASAHKNSNYLLKKDFKHFFPSIQSKDFAVHYKKYGSKYNSDDEIKLLQRLLFRRERENLELSIGAPSSPRVSNTILFDMDERIQSFCRSIGVTYTRYADDLSFSTRKYGILEDLNQWVEDLVHEMPYPILRFNEKKTVFLSRKCRRIVTGLVLTPNGAVSIGRHRKKEIKSLVHRFILQQLEPAEIAYLRGLLNFCNDVEIDFIHRLEKKYGEEVITTISRGG